MSIEVVQRTFANTHQRGSYLAALLFLSDRADHDGVSWYSVGRIADAINLKVRRTRQILRTLQERGEIVYAPHFYAGAGQTSNRYLVCCGLTPDEVARRLVEHPQFGLSPEEAQAAAMEVAAARGDRGSTVADGGSKATNGRAPAGAVGSTMEHGGSGRANGRAPVDAREWAADGEERGGGEVSRVGARAASGQAPFDEACPEPFDKACPELVEGLRTGRGQPLHRPWHLVGALRSGGVVVGSTGVALTDGRGPPVGRDARPDAGELWADVLVELEASMPQEVFRSHFLGSAARWAADVSPGRPPVLQVRPAHAASTPWLEHRYRERAERMAAGWLGEPVRVEFGA